MGLSFIELNAEKLFSSPGFLLLGLPRLQWLLRSDNLALSEVRDNRERDLSVMMVLVLVLLIGRAFPLCVLGRLVSSARCSAGRRRK